VDSAAFIGIGNHFVGCKGRLRVEGCGHKDKQKKQTDGTMREPRSLRLHSEPPSAHFKAQTRSFHCAPRRYNDPKPAATGKQLKKYAEETDDNWCEVY
jgi:hypothetical protein